MLVFRKNEAWQCGHGEPAMSCKSHAAEKVGSRKITTKRETIGEWDPLPDISPKRSGDGSYWGGTPTHVTQTGRITHIGRKFEEPNILDENPYPKGMLLEELAEVVGREAVKP